MSAPTTQRWRARLEDVEDPEKLLRLLNDFQQQAANVFGGLPLRVVREFEYTAPQRWLDATLENSWVAFGGDYPSAQYWKDEAGFVHLRGIVKSGTYNSAAAIFTLPIGYRPGFRDTYQVTQSSLFSPAGALDIGTDGKVYAPEITSVQSGTSTYLSFANVEFEAADPSPQPLPAPVLLTNLGFGRQAAGVQVLSCRDLTGNTAGVTPALAWAPSGQDAVKITQVFGLVPGHKYTLRVEIVG